MKKQREVRLLKPVRRRGEDSEGKSKADTVSWEGVDKEPFRGVARPAPRVGRRQASPALHHFQRRHLARAGPRSPLIAGKTPARLRHRRRQATRARRRLLAKNPRLLPRQWLDHRHGLAAPQIPRTRRQARRHSPAPAPPPSNCSANKPPSKTSCTRPAARTAPSWTTSPTSFSKKTSTTSPPGLLAEIQAQVTAAATKVGIERLKPIFIELGEKVPYDIIRLVVARMVK